MATRVDQFMWKDGDIELSQCVDCVHKHLDGARCPAFPDGIPEGMVLSDLKQLARRDLSGIEDVAALREVLQGYRQIAELLERMLDWQMTKPHPRIHGVLGTPEEIEPVLEAIEEKIEDLEIATNPEVHAAIENLIADFHFHDLRHTFASHLMMNRLNLKTVQVLLGHKDIRMTLCYSHLSREHL